MFRNDELQLAQIFLIYGQKNLDSGITSLDNFSNRVFPKHHRTTLVVDNKPLGGSNDRSRPELNIIQGDNSNREFSGWDTGIGLLEEKGKLSDTTTIVLANDTFHLNYGEQYLQLFGPRTTQGRTRKGQLVGYVDSYPREILLFGLPLKSWIRTSIVVCSWKSLRRLLPLSLPVPDSEIFSDDPEELFLPSAELSADYKEYLKTWLFQSHSSESEFQHSWHSKTDINEGNFDYFKDKARSILAEHFFSARARSLGVEIHAVNAKRFWK